MFLVVARRRTRSDALYENGRRWIFGERSVACASVSDPTVSDAYADDRSWKRERSRVNVSRDSTRVYRFTGCPRRTEPPEVSSGVGSDFTIRLRARNGSLKIARISVGFARSPKTGLSVALISGEKKTVRYRKIQMFTYERKHGEL